MECKTSCLRHVWKLIHLLEYNWLITVEHNFARSRQNASGMIDFKYLHLAACVTMNWQKLGHFHDLNCLWQKYRFACLLCKINIPVTFIKCKFVFEVSPIDIGVVRQTLLLKKSFCNICWNKTQWYNGSNSAQIDLNATEQKCHCYWQNTGFTYQWIHFIAKAVSIYVALPLLISSA